MRRTARVQGHFGELMQGRLGRTGPLVLISLPCPSFAAVVTVSEDAALSTEGDPAGLLSPERAGALLTALGRPARGRIHLSLTMPPGAGAGASSAALLALARATGAENPDQITRAALMVEGATDPLAYPDPTRRLWASREGRTVARLPALPRFEVLGGFLGPPRPTDPADIDFPDIADLISAWPAATAELARLAELVAESARRTLALRGPADDPILALATRHGALAPVIAHTGSARGLIFAPGSLPIGAEADLRAAGFSQITHFTCGG